MTTYNTGNPVPSADARDRYDNSQTLDEVVNGGEQSYRNRVGNDVLSLTGMRQRFDAAQLDRQTRFDTFITSSGYDVIGDYASQPVVFTERNQLMLKDGELWKPKANVGLPYTTTGDWGAESANFVSVGDAALRQELASGTGTELVGHTADYIDAVQETVNKWISRFVVDLETFGGRGDYDTENTPALARLLASGAKGLRLNRGAYRFHNGGIGFPTGLPILGVAAPDLGHGTFDDKQWLRTGYKHLMPGSSLIFSGSAANSYPCPQRVGDFATLRPCVRLYQGGQGSVGTEWHGFAIIQDMECRVPDGSRFTKPWEDNRADYDTGLMIDDCSRFKRTNVVIFGYFPKLGTAISSVAGNDDPDYNQMIGGSTMGRIGLGLLGSNNGPATHGLSGTHAFGHALYSLDHHSRGEMTPAELADAYADADQWRTLYVDGDVDASSAEINGHELHACSLRSNANHALEIDHCSNLEFFGGVYEFRPYGVPNSTTPTFIGSANVKRGVAFYNLRNNFPETILNPAFIGTIPVKVIVTGDPLNGRLGVFGKDPGGMYSAAILGSDGNIGDASIQLTRNAINGSSGWRGSIDVSAGDTLNWSYDGTNLSSMTTSGIRIPQGGERRHLSEVGPALTIASGAITITRSVHPVIPESGTADDLNTINGGVTGQVLTLRPSAVGHVITLRRTGGNIRLDASADKVLNGSLSSIRLFYNGSLWVQEGPVMTNG